MRSMVVLGTQERPTQRRTEPRQPVRLAVCGHPGHDPGLPWLPPKTSPGRIPSRQDRTLSTAMRDRQMLFSAFQASVRGTAIAQASSAASASASVR